jgi:LacI family transcriptional regulator
MPRNFVKPEKRIETRRLIVETIEKQKLWGQRLASEPTLAAELGVSRKTLRGALRELEAEGLVERRHGAGTFVLERGKKPRGQKAAQIAIIVKGRTDQLEGWDYSGEMIRAMLGWGRRLKVRCSVLSVADQEECERVWDGKYMSRFGGYVAVQHDDRTLLNHLLKLRRGPVALLDHTLRDLPIVGVVDGSFEGGRAVARHLLAMGHRRIGFVDCYNSPVTNPERIAGYKTALFEKGVDFDQELVVAQPVSSSRMTEEDAAVFARQAVEQLLGLADPATAIFAFDDNRALPVMRALEERGLRVGRDICLAGHGDSAFRKGTCDSLTSCRIYPRLMGREAIKAVLAGGEMREGRTIIVPNRLYIRQSSCPPSARNDARPRRDLRPPSRRS